MGNSNKNKRLTIYYEGGSQVVNYFKKTGKSDLLETIFKLLNLIPDQDIKQLRLNCIFQNSDGEPVVFDP
jgi:hypothetical protein